MKFKLYADWDFFSIGIIVPSNMTIGTVAPASPSQLFYPDVNGISARKNPPELLKLRALRGPPAFRAIGSIEAARVTLRDKVSIPGAVTTGNGETSGMKFTYSYRLSGGDFGLQRATRLSHIVSGSCETDYTWYQKDSSDAKKDVYHPWGIESMAINVDIDSFAPIKVDFVHHPGNSVDKPDDKFLYAVVVHAAGRRSYGAGRDPFFFTQTRATNETNAFAPYQVKSQRPVLSCQQTTYWELNGATAGSYHLKKLPGIDGMIGKYLLDPVFPNELGVPRLLSLAETIGKRSVFLSSSQASEDGLFDAEIASIWSDMERLILAAYASSRNILLDMTMVSDQHSLHNDAEGPDKKVPSDTADFVVATGDVTTLSATVLIAVPCILVFLMIVMGILEVMMMYSSLRPMDKKFAQGKEGQLENGQSPKATQIPVLDNFASRLRLLQATQLYRFLNERENYDTVANPSPEIKWEPDITGHSLHMPFSKKVEVRTGLLPISSEPLNSPRENQASPSLPSGQDDAKGPGERDNKGAIDEVQETNGAQDNRG
jgi:hypothetical protein